MDGPLSVAWIIESKISGLVDDKNITGRYEMSALVHSVSSMCF